MYSFEWDENKNRINKEKHGVSFEEAKTVFSMKRPYWNMMGLIPTKRIVSAFWAVVARGISSWLFTASGKDLLLGSYHREGRIQAK